MTAIASVKSVDPTAGAGSQRRAAVRLLLALPLALAACEPRGLPTPPRTAPPRPGTAPADGALPLR